MEALPEHWVESLIWDAAPTPGALEAGVIPAQEVVNLYDASGDEKTRCFPMNATRRARMYFSAVWSFSGT